MKKYLLKMGTFVFVLLLTGIINIPTVFANEFSLNSLYNVKDIPHSTYEFPRINDIAYNGNIYVAVGSSEVFLYSKDGNSWNRSYQNFTYTISPGYIYSIERVIWDGKRFIAVSSLGSKVYSSPDGINWTVIKEFDSCYKFHDIAWNGSTYVIIGEYLEEYENNDGTTVYGTTNQNIILHSSDGVSWDESVLCPPKGRFMERPLWAVIWDGSYFRAVGNSSISAYSKDGFSWSIQNNYGGSAGDTSSFFYDGKRYIGFSDFFMDNRIAYSLDGVKWNTLKSFNNRWVRNVTWDGTTYIAIVQKYSEERVDSTTTRYVYGNCYIVTSYDGINWSDETLLMNTDPNDGYQFDKVLKVGNQMYYTGQTLSRLSFIDIKLDGQSLNLNTFPIIYNNSYYLPLRDIAEAVGGTVVWDGKRQTITISKGSNTIELQTNKSVISVNGVSTTYNGSIRFVNGKAFAPLRLILENMGYVVDWNANSKTINIRSN